MKIRNTQIVIEQIALLFASLVWTSLVLTALAFFWAYQDVQARWEFVMNAPPEVLAAANASPTPTPLPSPTPWAGPGATLTPTPTQPPTPTPTRVILGPDLLPETLNPNDPTPIAVIVHTEDEAQEVGVALEQTSSQQSGSVTETAVGQAAAPPPAPEQSSPAIAASSAGIPTRLVIPSISIDAEIVPVGWSVIERNGQEYSIWQVADFAVGWHKTTAILGQPGNTVMAGHHNVNGEVFRDLVNVEVGDKVTAYSGGQAFEYVVEVKTIVPEKGEPVEVRRRNAEWIAPTDDERLTFVTCWPYTNNTHRVIVVAKRAG